MNDLNILSVSPHFSDVLAAHFPPFAVSYDIGEETFDWMYYLADGIYPDYKIFVKSFSNPTARNHKSFSGLQESVRKCVERVFGVLSSSLAYCLFQDAFGVATK